MTAGVPTPEATAGGVSLVHNGWQVHLDEAMGRAAGGLRIVCPFIKLDVIKHMLSFGAVASITVLTRFNLREFCEGVSDLEALALLLEHGARIRGVRGLHAKVYRFGTSRSIVASANLTVAALRSNHEFGFVSDDAAVAAQCDAYFARLWAQAEPDLTADQVAAWQEKVADYRTRLTTSLDAALGDEGADIELVADGHKSTASATPTHRSFVKFFGSANDRADRTRTVLWSVKESGCHWSCTYPKDRRPRRISDGDVVFTARLVDAPEDIVIFGRAIARAHVPGRDDATPADLARRPWKEKWPHYVRVRSGEFLGGDLDGGVSLNALMAARGPQAFATTAANAAKGHGNTNPRRAYLRQPAVELSPAGHAWVNARLSEAFETHGRLSDAEMATLDWPEDELR